MQLNMNFRRHRMLANYHNGRAETFERKAVEQHEKAQEHVDWIMERQETAKRYVEEQRHELEKLDHQLAKLEEGIKPGTTVVEEKVEVKQQRTRKVAKPDGTPVPA